MWDALCKILVPPVWKVLGRTVHEVSIYGSGGWISYSVASRAALTHSFNVPVLPHYYKDYDIPLLCTIPNGAGAESFDWIDPLIDHPIEIINGIARPHNRWGFGFKDELLTSVE